MSQTETRRGRMQASWATAGGRRRLARSGLSLAIAAGVVVESALRGAGALGPWSGFVGMIALVVLVGALVQASIRAMGAAAGLLGLAAILGGNGRLSGLHGAVEDAAVAACLLLVVEVGCWAGEVRTLPGSPHATAGAPDLRRLAFVLATSLGGGALGGLAIAVASTTRSAAGGILPVIGAAAAGCLVLLLALSLATPEPPADRKP
jgi:hypothetical protein